MPGGSREAEWHWEDRKFAVPGSSARVSWFQRGHNFHELSNCPAKFRRTAAPPAHRLRSPPPLPQPQLTALPLPGCGMGKVAWLRVTIRGLRQGEKSALEIGKCCQGGCASFWNERKFGLTDRLLSGGGKWPILAKLGARLVQGSGSGGVWCWGMEEAPPLPSPPTLPALAGRRPGKCGEVIMP